MSRMKDEFMRRQGLNQVEPDEPEVPADEVRYDSTIDDFEFDEQEGPHLDPIEVAQLEVQCIVSDIQKLRETIEFETLFRILYGIETRSALELLTEIKDELFRIERHY